MSTWRDDWDSESPTPEWRERRGRQSREEDAEFGNEDYGRKSRRKERSPVPDDAPWWLREGTARLKVKEETPHVEKRNDRPASPDHTPWWMRKGAGTGLGWQPHGEAGPAKDEVLSGEDTPPLPARSPLRSSHSPQRGARSELDGEATPPLPLAKAEDDEGSVTPPLPMDEESVTPPLEAEDPKIPEVPSPAEEPLRAPRRLDRPLTPPGAPGALCDKEVEGMVLQALREKDPTIPQGWPAIVAAAYTNEMDSIQWLVTSKADVNAITSSKSTALWHAVNNQNTAMVHCLLEARADPNHVKKNAKGVRRSLLDVANNDGAPPPIINMLEIAGGLRHKDLERGRRAEREFDPELLAAAAEEGRRPLKRPRLRQIVEEDDSFHNMLTRIRDVDPKHEPSSPSTPPLDSRPGRAYAERSAFKKAYARKMLPLSGEKPVLDFSAYSTAYNTSVTPSDRLALTRARAAQAEAPRRIRIFAGMEIPLVRGLRDHEAERWRRGIGSNIELSAANEEKPEVLMDPWGCSLAGKKLVEPEPEEPLPPKRMPAPAPAPLVAPVAPPAPVPLPLKAMPAAAAPPPKLPSKAMPAMPVPPGPVPGPSGASAPMAGAKAVPKPPEVGLSAGVQKDQSSEDSGQRSHKEEAKTEETEGAGSGDSQPSDLVKAKAMPRKPEGAEGAQNALLPPPPESLASLADLPNLCEGLDKDDEAPDDEVPKQAEQKKPPALPPVQALMGMGFSMEDLQLLQRQMSIVREMAGGSKFHDPARDPSAYRKQAQNMCLIEVSQLKFCHKDIGQRFTHGRHRGQPVLKLLEELHSRRVDAQELPPLVVMRKENTLQVVCGNRRLYCLKRYALEASKAVNVWCVVYDLKSKETPRPLVFKYILATTTEDSDRISARGR